MPGVRRIEPVHVKCFGRTWRLRAVPASVWIAGAASPDMSGLFPGLVRGSDSEQLLDVLLQLELPDMSRRCRNVSHAALARVSGREWHWAYNLIMEARKSWPHLNGMLVRQNVRTDDTDLASWIDAAYTLLREVYDEKERKAFDQRLRAIPRNAGPVKPVMSGRADLIGFAAD